MRGVRGLFRRDQARAAQLEVDRLSVRLQAWQQRLAELDEPPDRGVGRQGTAAQRHAASADLPQAAEFAPPSYLTALLGPRPDEPVARSAWRTGVRAADSYRSAWGVTDTSHPLGEPPADQVQRRAYQAALAAIRAAQPGGDGPAPSRSHSPRAGISVG